MTTPTTTITSTVGRDDEDAGAGVVVEVVCVEDDGCETRPATMVFQPAELHQAQHASHRLHMLHLLEGEGDGDEDGGRDGR